MEKEERNESSTVNETEAPLLKAVMVTMLPLMRTLHQNGQGNPMMKHFLVLPKKIALHLSPSKGEITTLTNVVMKCTTLQAIKTRS